MFSYEYCKISNNTCFEEHLCTAASENNEERFIEKATSHHDHYMINVGGQRPKIGGNWLLTGPYLQHWAEAIGAGISSFGKAARKLICLNSH